MPTAWRASCSARDQSYQMTPTASLWKGSPANYPDCSHEARDQGPTTAFHFLEISGEKIKALTNQSKNIILSPVLTFMSESSLLEDVGKIKSAIWAKRPIFGGILDRHGTDSLSDYAKDFLDINSLPVYLENRRGELYVVVHEMVTARLNKTVADELITQLEKFPFVSTTDHHGIVDHPYWINSNITTALPLSEAQNEILKYIPVFSFASVSLNNASAYPRGILLHGKSEVEEMIRLPFLPDKNKMSVVYATRSFDQSDIDRSYEYLNNSITKGELSVERANELKDFIHKNIAIPEILKCKKLSEQITKINYSIWPKFFHTAQTKPGEGKYGAPADLIYIEIEKIITELLTRFHLKNHDSLIYRTLFDANCQQFAKQYFNGLAGSFSLENKWGTYFFWGLDEKLRRVELELINGHLVSEKAKIFLPFTPEAIEDALLKEKIFPNMFLCYIITAFYYGLKCLGGFSQVHDLTVIKKAWQSYLREIGEGVEIDAIEPVQTMELSGGGVVLSYQEICDNCGLIPATGIDMYLDRRDTSFEKYLKLSKQVTLMDMMTVMLPEIYTVLYSAPARDEYLAHLSASAIMKATGVEDILRNYFKSL